MAGDSSEATSTSQPPTWRRTVQIVAVFAVLGPLLGALSVVALLVMVAVFSDLLQGRLDNIAGLLGGGLLTMTLASLPVAYAIGAIPSLGVGLVVAMRDRARGGISLPTALTAAAVLALVMAAFAVLAIPQDGLVIWLVALFVAHLSAAWLCTGIARRLAGSRMR